MCRRCGIKGEVELRPYVTLSEEERGAAAPFADCLVVQSSRRSASLAIGNKEWLPERFQSVTDELLRQHRVVQLGLRDDPPLHGAEDWRGRTSLRESAAILAQARGFVGLVGFLMHLARAVECPAVIVYGGRERPDQSGYSCNENLYSAVPCAPCWRWNSCVLEHQCMTSIGMVDVVAAVSRLLARPRSPLVVDRFSLT
jgi:ADP-heptose:LPS heptosyltransferase